MQAASAVLQTRLCSQTKETIKKIPAILQGEARTRFLQGIAFGAVAAMAIGFIWGGWVTGGTARTMSAMAENSGRMSILVPMCVASRSSRRLMAPSPSLRRRAHIQGTTSSVNS
jgi:hypothetical protein